ncbi:hypothetical protein RUND412_001294 [Rhizina undulata]
MHARANIRKTASKRLTVRGYVKLKDPSAGEDFTARILRQLQEKGFLGVGIEEVEADYAE